MRKKCSHLILLIVASCLPFTARGIAQEETKKIASEQEAVSSQSSPSVSTEKPVRETSVAAVADAAKKETSPTAVTAKTVSTEPSQASASSLLNSAEMQRRWEKLLSKEITPDSILYTIKPGDRLYILAKKNHTTVELIKLMNGLKSNDIYPGMKLKIHAAPFTIKIDKSKNILVLYSGGEAVKKYSVATGKKNCTPVGTFKITDKLTHPTWFKTGAILPPGSPENALGTRWMGIDKQGYGIHGTIEPKSIGTQASEGCVRMLNEEVEELYNVVPVGTQVTIQD